MAHETREKITSRTSTPRATGPVDPIQPLNPPEKLAPCARMRATRSDKVGAS
jgi:hypothetical protein